MGTIQKILIILLLVFSHFAIPERAILFRSGFYLFLILLSVLAVIEFLKSSKHSKIIIPELLLFTFILYLYINNSVKIIIFAKENLYNYLIIFLLYFVFVVYYNKNKNVLKYFLYGITIITSIELIIGFGQLFRFLPNANANFILGGLFGNPAAFAGYLAITIPFLLVVCLNFKEFSISENLQIVIIGCFCSSVFLVILCNSRGAWLASFLSVIFVLNEKYKFITHFKEQLKTLKSKLAVGILLCISIVFISLTLYQYKK